MDIWKKKKSPFGYEIDENGIDSYGVDHNKFSLRDELGYQYDRSEYENNMLERQNNKDCYMTFDGKNLNLYNNQKQINSLEAQSGQDDFQSSKYQDVVDKGPIPEGTYFANQDERQTITPKMAIEGIGAKLLNIDKGKWQGGPISWGTKRVWIHPDKNTNTYGRDGFSIHGGLTKGSGGCIDIPWQTDKLDDYLDGCQYSVPLYVKYPKNW